MSASLTLTTLLIFKIIIMKKLNRTEISVLAKKISEEINSENQKKKAALLKAYKPSAKFIEFTKTLQTAQKACSKIYKAIGYRITIDIFSRDL